MSAISCDVWMLNVEDIAPEQAERFITTEERDHLERLSNRGDQVRYAGARTLLRTVGAHLADVPPCEVKLGHLCVWCGSKNHGKPYLENVPEHVSITHSAGLVLVAVTDAGPVGVDVERNDSSFDSHRIANYFLAPDEARPESAEDFYRIWCRKEAVVKASGEGITTALSQVRVTSADEGARLLSYPRVDQPVALSDLDLTAVVANYAAAVAVLTAGTLDPHLRDGTALLERTRPLQRR